MRQEEIQSSNIVTTGNIKRAKAAVTPSEADEMRTYEGGKDGKPQEPRDDGEHAGKWAVLAIVAVGVFMATLDSSIVNIRLPTVAHFLGVPLCGYDGWVFFGYLG